MYQSEGERDHGDTGSVDPGGPSDVGHEEDDASMRDDENVEGQADGQSQTSDGAPATPRATDSKAGTPGPAEDITMSEPRSGAATPASSTAGSSGSKRRGKQRARGEQPGQREREHQAKRARTPSVDELTGADP